MANDPKSLCLKLAYSDTEQEVISILKEAGYWDDDSAWNYYGGNENNFSVIGNQQSTAEAALVEKIVNSVDAVLLRECFIRGGKPNDVNAPKSVEEALEKFFGIYKGKLTSIDARTRSALADSILLVASGSHANPSYAVIDKGEGQTPKMLPFTFLSLSKSNKLRIPFVQGKFNMGATGSLQFCGKHNIQLIISRKDPAIAGEDIDDTADYWGFTIIRREDPSKGIRSSTFRYLSPNNQIVKFQADSLPLLPSVYPNPYGERLEHGSYIKLFEYKLKGGLKTQIKLDLYYKLSLLLPHIALPITMYERRIGYRAQSYQAIMSGLSVRLDEDKQENLEEGYPSSSEIQVSGERMRVQVYAFKKGQAEKYAPKEGIIFTVNGQAHGFIARAFYERRSVGMSYLKDSILIMADCSEFSGRTREDLFMNSRDRLRDGEIKEEIEGQLEDLIKNHQGLKDLRERRRREEIESILQDSRPLANVIEHIVKKSPSLSKLFISGVAITNPFDLRHVGMTKNIYVGKRYPTYFTLAKEYSEEKPKNCHKNLKCRVQFETDAENDYFNRDIDQGEFRVSIDGIEMQDYTLNLWNGLATLTISLPSNKNIGNLIHLKAEAGDRTQTENFVNEFYIKVIEEAVHKGGSGERKNPPSNENDEQRQTTVNLALPNIIECHKSDSDYRFKDDEEGALAVVSNGDEGYDFFVNMDNTYLRLEQKGSLKEDPKLLEARYKYGMVLIGLSFLNAFEKNRHQTENEADSESEKVYFFAKAIAPVLLPMVKGLADMAITD